MVGLVSLGRRREATLKGFFSHVLTEFEEILLFAYCGDIMDHVGKFCKPPAGFINVRNLFFCKRAWVSPRRLRQYPLRRKLPKKLKCLG